MAMERQRFFGISMVPSVFQRLSGDPEESVKSVLSIYSIRVDVQEQFEQKQRFKRLKDDYIDQSHCPLEN